MKECGFKLPSTSSDRSSQGSSPPFSVTAKRKFVTGRVGDVEDGDDEGTEESSARYLDSLHDTREEEKAKKKSGSTKKEKQI